MWYESLDNPSTQKKSYIWSTPKKKVSFNLSLYARINPEKQIKIYASEVKLFSTSYFTFNLS